MRAIRVLLLLAFASGLTAAPATAADGHPLDHAQETLDRVAPLVEKACGAKFDEAPHVAELEPAEARGVFAEDMRAEFARRYADLAEAQRDGLLRLAASTSVQSCVARYSFTSRAVVVVRDAFDAQCASLRIEGGRRAQFLTAALAHEAVHALDDRRFGLSKLYHGVADDEALRAAAMVVEGRAVHFGRIAAAAAGVPDDLRGVLPGGAAPKGEREWLLHLTYRLGERFVGDLVTRGGLPLAETAITSPPRTTWLVCAPSRWPDAEPDGRPAAVLAKAGFAGATRTLSDLQLRARYAAMKGLDASETLLAASRGGAQALADGTNSAVLAFADEESAARFEAVSRDETPTRRRGTLVARAIGPGQDAAIALLADALDAVADVR